MVVKVAQSLKFYLDDLRVGAQIESSPQVLAFHGGEGRGCKVRGLLDTRDNPEKKSCKYLNVKN